MPFFRHRKRSESHRAALAALATTARAAAAPHHNYVRIRSLSSLPAELLSMVCSYLPLEDICTLMVTCAHFWKAGAGDGVFAPAWQRLLEPPQPKGFDDSSREARFHMLRMLEYDGVFPKGRYCCWGCLATHGREAFSLQETARSVDLKAGCVTDPTTSRRYCLTTKRCFRFGVCNELSFVELKDMIADHESNHRVPFLEGPKFCLYYDTETNQIMNIIELARFWDINLGDDLSPILGAINIPLCPHICLGSKEVIKLFKKNTKPNYAGGGSGKRHNCKHCKTSVSVCAEAGFVRFEIRRSVGRLESPTDPTWLAQTFSSKDPRLDGHCAELKRRLVREHGDCFWLTVQPPIESLDEIESDASRPDFDRLFTPVSLPGRWALRCKRFW